MKKHLLSLLIFLAALPIAAFGAGVDEAINNFFAPITKVLEAIVFVDFKIPIGETTYSVPFFLVILIGTALYFTFYFRFPFFRHFRLAIDIVRGKYKEPNSLGEVTHFQALAAALSGTVGLGNIAGVAVAITIGGPGATFWMIVAGILGMSSKFVECTLGVKYREVDANGTVYGGPMYYLSRGFGSMRMLLANGKELTFSGIGKFLAVVFAVATIGGSIGGGNMLQINQTYKQLNDISAQPIQADQVNNLIGKRIFTPGGQPHTLTNVQDGQALLTDGTGTQKTIPLTQLTTDYSTRPLDGWGWLVGLFFAILVGIVIIGGIKSIARVADKLVPFMCGMYMICGFIVIGANYENIPSAAWIIIESAFGYHAVAGGMVGVLLVGFQRASFSNEAGIGSASIAHAAVQTNYPASEGIVALLEPFIDTVLVCTMTALVIVVSGKYTSTDVDGVTLTSVAFAEVITWFPYLLSLAVVLFAFATMITWSYYGSQAWAYMFGRSKLADYSFKLIYCAMIVVGAASQMKAVFGFSDAMIFSMLFPNVVGLLFLTPVVKYELEHYLDKIRTGVVVRIK